MKADVLAIVSLDDHQTRNVWKMTSHPDWMRDGATRWPSLSIATRNTREKTMWLLEVLFGTGMVSELSHTRPILKSIILLVSLFQTATDYACRFYDSRQNRESCDGRSMDINAV